MYINCITSRTIFFFTFPCILFITLSNFFMRHACSLFYDCTRVLDPWGSAFGGGMMLDIRNQRFKWFRLIFVWGTTQPQLGLTRNPRVQGRAASTLQASSQYPSKSAALPHQGRSLNLRYRSSMEAQTKRKIWIDAWFISTGHPSWDFFCLGLLLRWLYQGFGLRFVDSITIIHGWCLD